MKIAAKLVLTFTPLALAMLVVLGSLAYFSARDSLTEHIYNHLESVASSEKRQINSIIEQNHERLALVSSRTQLRLSLEKYLSEPKPEYSETMNRILKDAGSTIEDFRKLSVQTLEGRIVASTDVATIGQIDTKSPYFHANRLENRVDLIYRNAQGELGIFLTGPLKLGDKILGTLVIDSDVSNIVSMTTNYQGLGESGESLLVRDSGQGDAIFLMPARFDSDAALKLTIPSDSTDSPYIVALSGRAQLFTESVDYSGEKVIAITRLIDSTGWGLVVQMRVEEALKPIIKLRTSLATLIGLSSLLVILASLYFARSITRPITQLTEVATRISHQKFAERAEISTSDEVGILAKAFNRMTEYLVDDIEERRKAEERFQALLQSAPDPTVIVDPQGHIVLINLQAEKIFGFEEQELKGEPVERLISGKDPSGQDFSSSEYFRQSKLKPVTPELELSVICKDGKKIPVEISLSPIETNDGLLVASSIRDISDRKEVEARLVQQASIDSLTGLPNRWLAADRLSQALARARRSQKSVAVMFIDLDRFKNINDSLGHSFGDKLLAEVASRLEACVRKEDTVARLGGDEFLIILPEMPNLVTSEITANKVLEALSLPCVLDERELFIGASIGISGFPEDGYDADELMRDADAAMYRAKDEGRNTYRFFTKEMNVQLHLRLDMESRLRYAISRDELYLEFQPQVDINSGRLVGAEALLRWDNPELGLISPDEFIPLAEETGLINSLGEWVLMQACQAASAWQSHLPGGVRIAVNVSAVQFRDNKLVSMVGDILEACELDPALLELEITERVLVEDHPNISLIFSQLKAMGIRLALDDFGTGYSSLSYLKRFPFDILKIDRTFISGLTVNPEDTALCKAITAMAKSLNLSLVAEGVETLEQWDFLQTQGVGQAQGYYISHPLSGDKLLELITGGGGILRHNIGS